MAKDMRDIIVIFPYTLSPSYKSNIKHNSIRGQVANTNHTRMYMQLRPGVAIQAAMCGAHVGCLVGKRLLDLGSGGGWVSSLGARLGQ